MDEIKVGTGKPPLFRWALSRGDILTIARRFNAGGWFRIAQVPKGRLHISYGSESAVPSGLEVCCVGPGVETPGYSHQVPAGQQDRAIPEVFDFVAARLL